MKELIQRISDRKILALIIFISSFIVYLIDVDKPHELWDERARYVVGLNQWFNVINGKFDSESWVVNYFHPPLGKYLYGLVNGAYLFLNNPNILSIGYDEAIQIIDQTKNFLPGRMLAILLASGSVVMTYLLGEEFFNRKVGALAALFLVFMPAFTSNVRIESLEAPLVFFFLLTVYMFFKALKTGGNNNYYILSGISAGLAISTKFNNLILYLLLPVIYLSFLFLKKEKISLRKILPTKLFLTAVIPFAVLFLIWPWLWNNPISNFQKSLSWWTYINPEYFLGSFTVQPVYYYLVYFFATMPTLLIVFFLASMKESFLKNPYTKLLFIWFFTSILFFSLADFKQNGSRYVISVYPAFAILAAIGFLNINKIFSRLDKKIPIIFGVLIAAYLIFNTISIHPYYLDYYNELTGGPSTVYEMKLFNMGWQGEGIDVAVKYLNENAAENSTVEFHAVPSHTSHNLRSDIMEVNPVAKDGILRLSDIEIDQNLHQADFAVVNTYFDWYINGTFRNILSEDSYSVEKIIDVKGAPLVWIYKKSDKLA